MRLDAVSSILAVLAGACAGSGAATRKEFTHEALIHAPPERVFPLLCPIREKEWIDGWDARVLWSRSGVAEDNAMFATHIESGETWVTTRYEPERFRVEYTIFAGGHAVLRMDLALADAGHGTTRWTTRRTYTGLDVLGRALISRTTERQVLDDQDRLARQLEYFLANGKMLVER